MKTLLENESYFIDYLYRFYPDIICVYGDPSLKMRIGVDFQSYAKDDKTKKEVLGLGNLFIDSIYPNPLYDDNLSINITSNSDNNIDIKIYDIFRRLVNSSVLTLINGLNKINIDTSSLASGVYIKELYKDEFSINKKFVRMR